MATCGDYELERAIGWGRRSTLFAARMRDAEGPATVVVRRARIVERRFRDTFLSAAAEQQAAVVAGCRRIAPILAFDCDDAGFPFYATARYETSAAEMLEAGGMVDDALMREIVTGVLGVLAELHDKSRRAHGNLTPGNILLDAQGRVFLTDLAPTARDATTADDLFAVGTLIYQFVRRTARIGMLNPPLDYSPAWTESLGDDAEGWRELTNRLLTKSRNAAPEALQAAAAGVKSLAKLASTAAKAAQVPLPGESRATQAEVRRAPPIKRSPLPKVLAGLLVVGGGAGGVVWWKKNEAAKKESIALALAAAAKLEHDKALPDTIKSLRADLKKGIPKEFDEDRTLTSLLARIGKSLEASGNKNDVVSLLGNWELPDKLRAQAVAWRTAPREWTALAGQLEGDALIDPDEEKPILEQLKAALAAKKNAGEVEREWTNVTFMLKDLAATNNALLPNFEPWATQEIGSAKNLGEAAERARQEVEKLREVLTFQREMGARVLWKRFEKEAGEVAQTPASGLMQGWPDRWKREAERFTGPTDEKRAAWEKRLASVSATIPKLASAEQAKWKALFQEANAAIPQALESDVPQVDALLVKFDAMRLPIEIAKEQYTGILKTLIAAAAAAKDKKEAKDALAKFDAATKSVLAKFDPQTKKQLGDFQTSAGTADLVSRLSTAISTPDRISLNFSQPGWENVTPETYEPTAAKYKFTNGGEAFEVPFLALPKSDTAMAAIETPLILARMSGVVPNGPAFEAGPQTRRNGFHATTDWLWKAPTDLQNRGLGIRYFPAANRVVPGDVGTDACPATWMTFQEASTVAAKLGGALPTSEQWTSALSQTGAAKRMRARAWTEQSKLIAVWLKQTQEPQFASRPDRGSFSTKTGLKGPSRDYLEDTNPVPGATDDGKLWLTTVGFENWTPRNGFVNLIGNAAEWVDNNGSPSVIGGSVVSPASLPTNTPLAVRDGAYFDVTFRLAVKLGGGGEGAGMKKFKEITGAIAVPASAPEP